MKSITVRMNPISQDEYGIDPGTYNYPASSEAFAQTLANELHRLYEVPVEVEYSLRFKNLRRINPSLVEATHRIDFDAEYQLRIGLPGERPVGSAPATLGIWVDGRLAHSMPVKTEPSGLVYFNPYSEEAVRLPLSVVERAGTGDLVARTTGDVDAEYAGHGMGPWWVGKGLTLALLVARVGAEHAHHAGTADDAALVADALDGCPNFHGETFPGKRRPLLMS